MVKARADWGRRGRRNRIKGWFIHGVADASTPFWCGIGVFGLISAILLHAPGAFAQCSYEITATLVGPPCLPGFPATTFATGLSDNGIVVGRYEICGTAYWEGFMWVPNPDAPGGGTFTTLPRPTGVLSAWPTGVNSHGIVIGTHHFQGVGPKGFVYDPSTGQFQYLEPVHDGVSWTPVTTATAINDSNIVTGSRIISEPGVSPPVHNAVIWMPYGESGVGPEVIVDLGVGDGPNSGAHDGNDGTDAAGWSGTGPNTVSAQALLWSKGNVITLGVLPNAVQSAAWAASNLPEVVGRSSEGQFIAPHGFRWSNGQMSAMIPPEPFGQFWPFEVKDWGQIAGVLRISANEQFAGLWQSAQFHEIAPLVMDPPPQFSPSSVARINSKGQILVDRHLLTPVNVPTGDLNFDCKVDVHDLLYLLSEWGKPGSSADLNGDGTVGVPDLLILLANWGS